MVGHGRSPQNVLARHPKKAGPCAEAVHPKIWTKEVNGQGVAVERPPFIRSASQYIQSVQSTLDIETKQTAGSST